MGFIISGASYNTKNMSVIINVSDENNDLLTLFGLIKCIFIIKNEPFITYNLFDTINYVKHFGAFYVKFSSKSCKN